MKSGYPIDEPVLEARPELPGAVTFKEAALERGLDRQALQKAAWRGRLRSVLVREGRGRVRYTTLPWVDQYLSTRGELLD